MTMTTTPTPKLISISITTTRWSEEPEAVALDADGNLWWTTIAVPRPGHPVVWKPMPMRFFVEEAK